MSEIENRIVSIKFDNKSFEQNIGETLKSIDDLNKSLSRIDGKSAFVGMSEAAEDVSLDGIGEAVDNISGKFSALGAIAFTALQSLTNSAIDSAKRMAGLVFDPLLGGGKQRALNIENAKFQFRGLGLDVEAAMASAKEAVLGTAYGLDSAAKAAAQFGASGIKVGGDMTEALRGIAGAAAMSNSSFDEIAGIFTTIAGMGKASNQQLNQFSFRGLNAAAAIGKQINKTEAQVREMAANGELDFKTFSKAMSGAFGEHATKANETYTGSLANMRAALSRIGAAFYTPYLETQRDIFNALSPAIDKVAKAIAPLVTAFTEITRIKADNLIKFINSIDFTDITEAMPKFAEGIKNIFSAISALILPIKEAFRDIFPKSAGGNLQKIAEAFADFTAKLKIGGKTAESVKNIFRGIFAALTIGFEAVKEVGKLFGDIFSALFDVAGLSGSGGGILKYLSDLGEKIVDFKHKLVNFNGISDFFNRLSAAITGFIKDPAAYVDDLKDIIVDSLNEIKATIIGFLKGVPGAENVEKIFGRIEGRLDSINKTSKKVRSSFEGAFSGIFESVKAVFEEIWNYISEWFSELGTNLAKEIKPGDFNAAIDVVNVGLLGGIGVLLSKFLGGGFKIDFGGITSVMDRISGALDSLTGTLEAMQLKLKAEAIMKLALAIGVLTISIVVLSLIDSAALTKALVAMSVGFGQLVGVLALMEKITADPKAGAKLVVLAGALILIAGAMILLAIAIRMLSSLSWAELGKGLFGVAGGLIVLTTSTQLIAENTDGLFKAGLAMITISIALLLLAKAVQAFGSMSWAELAKGLIGISVGLGALVLALNNMPDDAKLVSIGISLLTISVALLILAEAVQAFASMSWGEMVKGLIGIGAGLLIISEAMWFMPPNMFSTAASLLVLSVALNVMAKAVESMGSLSLGTLAKGLGSIAIMLGILAVAMILMTGTSAGAGALIVASAAILILANALEKFGKLSIAQIVTGLGAMAAIFFVLGGAALLLGPIIPILFSLGVALGLLGIAFALFGIGASLVAKAFETIARAGQAGVAVVLEVINMVIMALPKLITAFVISLIQLAEELLAAAPRLLALVTVLLVQILDTIIELTPKIAEALAAIITAGLILMRSKFPELLQTGFAMLMELLRGVRDNMIEIATLAVDIIIKFVNTLLMNAVKLTAAAVSLLLSFLGAIASRSADIAAAGVNLLVSFLSGISNNLGKVIFAVATIITTFITEVGKNLSRIVTSGVSAVISFIEGVGKDMQRVVTAGVNVVLAFIDGLAKNAVRFTRAAADILIDFLNGMATAIRDKAPELRAAGKNIAGAVISGLTGGLFGGQKDANNASNSTADGVIGSFMNRFKSASPSKVFIGIGKTLTDGLAYALDNDNTAENSAVKHAERIINAFQDSLSHIPDSLAGMDEFNPVITPVLDLTKVQMASRNLNSLMAVSSITPEVSYDRARLISTTTDLESTSSEGTAYTGPSEITFEQNIYAPEALSTNDIYRNTKSQIVLAKEELGIS
jgi:hypothetical protein